MAIMGKSMRLESHEPEHNRIFNCQYCGRFSHFVEGYYSYNGSFTDLVLVWNCSKCGYCKEGQW